MSLCRQQQLGRGISQPGSQTFGEPWKCHAVNQHIFDDCSASQTRHSISAIKPSNFGEMTHFISKKLANSAFRRRHLAPARPGALRGHYVMRASTRLVQEIWNASDSGSVWVTHFGASGPPKINIIIKENVYSISITIVTLDYVFLCLNRFKNTRPIEVLMWNTDLLVTVLLAPLDFK